MIAAKKESGGRTITKTTMQSGTDTAKYSQNRLPQGAIFSFILKTPKTKIKGMKDKARYVRREISAIRRRDLLLSVPKLGTLRRSLVHLVDDCSSQWPVQSVCSLAGGEYPRSSHLCWSYEVRGIEWPVGCSSMMLCYGGSSIAMQTDQRWFDVRNQDKGGLVRSEANCLALDTKIVYC